MILVGCGQSPDSEDTRAAYDCEGGERIYAAYPSDQRAVVEYQGRTVDMEITVAASGARYAGEDLIWWTRGSGPGSMGTLYRQGTDDMDELLELCTGAEE